MPEVARSAKLETNSFQLLSKSRISGMHAELIYYGISVTTYIMRVRPALAMALPQKLGNQIYYHNRSPHFRLLGTIRHCIPSQGPPFCHISPLL